MFALFRIVLQLLSDLAGIVPLAVRRQRALAAEILMLSRQAALYLERGAKPRRIDPVTRVRLALLSRFLKWRDALVVVRPETMIRWHRAGWRLFLRLKSRPGRPRIPKQVQDLIRRMGSENPTWGEERITNELLLKLGVQISPGTTSVDRIAGSRFGHWEPPLWSPNHMAMPADAPEPLDLDYSQPIVFLAVGCEFGDHSAIHRMRAVLCSIVPW